MNTPILKNRSVKFRLLRVLLLSVSFLAVAQISFAENLFPNGEFDQPNSDSTWPAKIGKPSKGSYSWEDEAGERFIRMSMVEPLQTVMIYQQFGLKGADRVEIKVRARVTGLVKGPKSWFDARIMGDFRGSASQKIKDIKPIVFGRDTDGWVERSVIAEVPQGAIFMALMPTLLQPNEGTLDIASITVTPLAPEPVQP